MSSSSTSSSPSASLQQKQTNPFLLHQQRQYYQQQHLHSYYNHHDLNAPSSYELFDNDENVKSESQMEKVSEEISVSFSNYLKKAAATIMTSTESSLIGDRSSFFGDDLGMKDNLTDFNYILMRNGGLLSENSAVSSEIDSSEMTTSLPLAGNVGGGGGLGGNFSVFEGNFWAVFDEQYLRHSLGWTVTLVVAYTLILVIGIIGNCMVILVVIFRPQMRTVTNMFIMNLAVADLFVIVFCVPATLLANVFTPWILGSFMCKGVAYVQGVSVCASAYSLAAISLDRCKAIYRALERPRGLSKSQALFTICLIWIVALLMTIPWAVIFNVILNKKDGLSYCVETWENEQHGKIYFLFANLFACYCLPLVLISISNVIIWCHVAHRKVPQDSASANTIKKLHKKTRHGVRKMLGIVTLAFLLSWLPLYVLVTRVKFSQSISEDEANVLDILMPLAQWLGSWNSSINPVLYAFLNSKFREMFKSLLPTWFPFVQRERERTIARNNIGRATITNGTITMGATGTPSHGSVFTTRSSTMRSSGNSRNFRRNKNNHSQRTLLVSSFRGGHVTAAAVVGTRTVVVGGECGVIGGGATVTEFVGDVTYPISAENSGTITDL